jgi:hypothetical protein
MLCLDFAASSEVVRKNEYVVSPRDCHMTDRLINEVLDGALGCKYG